MDLLDFVVEHFKDKAKYVAFVHQDNIVHERFIVVVKCLAFIEYTLNVPSGSKTSSNRMVKLANTCPVQCTI